MGLNQIRLVENFWPLVELVATAYGDGDAADVGADDFIDGDAAVLACWAFDNGVLDVFVALEVLAADAWGQPDRFVGG